MYKVGITGGIGAGKSFVAKLFKLMDIPIYDADTEAKRLIVEHEELKQNIKALIGEEAYLPNGAYNRAFVGQQVFSNPDLLQRLNELVHPAVHADLQSWFSNQKTPYAIEEAALIVESSGYKFLDAIILVSCPKELKIERVMKRNSMDRTAVEKRMATQSSDNEKRKYCHFEIINDEQHFLISQVQHIHQTLLSFNK